MDIKKTITLELDDKERQCLSDLLEFARRYMHNEAKSIDIEFSKDGARNEFMLMLDRFFDAL